VTQDTKMDYVWGRLFWVSLFSYLGVGLP